MKKLTGLSQKTDEVDPHFVHLKPVGIKFVNGGGYLKSAESLLHSAPLPDASLVIQLHSWCRYFPDFSNSRSVFNPKTFLIKMPAGQKPVKDC